MYAQGMSYGFKRQFSFHAPSLIMCRSLAGWGMEADGVPVDAAIDESSVELQAVYVYCRLFSKGKKRLH